MPRSSNRHINYGGSQSHRIKIGEFNRKSQERLNDPEIQLAIQNMKSKGLNFSSNSGKFIASMLFLTAGLSLIPSASAIQSDDVKYDDQGEIDNKQFRDQVKESLSPSISKGDKSLILKSINRMALSDKKMLSSCLMHMVDGNSYNEKPILVRNLKKDSVVGVFSAKNNNDMGELDGKTLERFLEGAYKSISINKKRLNINKKLGIDNYRVLANVIAHEAFHCNQELGMDHGEFDARNKDLKYYFGSLKSREDTAVCVSNFGEFRNRLEKTNNDVSAKKNEYLVNLGVSSLRSWKDLKPLMIAINHIDSNDSFLLDIEKFMQKTKDHLKKKPLHTDFIKVVGSSVFGSLKQYFLEVKSNTRDTMLCAESVAHFGGLPPLVRKALDQDMDHFVNNVKKMVFDESYRNLEDKKRSSLEEIFHHHPEKENPDTKFKPMEHGGISANEVPKLEL